MTTLMIAAVDVAGVPLAHHVVEVAVIAGRPGGHRSAGGAVIAAPVQIRLDETGAGSVEVTPTGDLDAPGAFARCTVLGSSPTIVRSLTIPDVASVDWADPAVQVADPVIPEVGVTRSQLDAALAGLGGGGGVTVHGDLTGRSAAGQHPASAVTGPTGGLTPTSIAARWAAAAAGIELDPASTAMVAGILPLIATDPGSDVAGQLANAVAVETTALAWAVNAGDRAGAAASTASAASTAADAVDDRVDALAALVESLAPSTVDIIPIQPDATTGAYVVWEASASEMHRGHLTIGGAVGWWAAWDRPMRGGTWSITGVSRRGSWPGVAEIQIDGVPVASWDQSGATANDVHRLWTGITVPSTGMHRITVRVAGPGGSGGLPCEVAHMQLRRTGP